MDHHTTDSSPEGLAAPHTRGSVIHWARLYDALTNVVGGGTSVRSTILDRAELGAGERVLDVGCGPGRLALLAKARAGDGEVHGIDPSTEMIELAKEKAKKAGLDVRFRTGVIEDLPFPDGTFQLVTSSFMLHHLPDDLKSQGFAEIARVLRPGGRFLAVDLSGKGSFFWRLMSLVGHRLPDDYAERLTEMMRGAGLLPEVLPSERPYLVIRATKAVS